MRRMKLLEDTALKAHEIITFIFLQNLMLSRKILWIDVALRTILSK